MRSFQLRGQKYNVEKSLGKGGFEMVMSVRRTDGKVFAAHSTWKMALLCERVMRALPLTPLAAATLGIAAMRAS